MDWACYKALCDQPDYWSRWMLEQCAELFEQLGETDLRLALLNALQDEPLAAPQDHTGALPTQMFQLCLTAQQRMDALQAIQQAVARGLATEQTRRRGLGGFIEAWRDYAESGGMPCRKF